MKDKAITSFPILHTASSHELLSFVFKPVRRETIAELLKISKAMVDKWCQETPATNPNGSGARNFLDRLGEIREHLDEQGRRDLVLLLYGWLNLKAGLATYDVKSIEGSVASVAEGHAVALMRFAEMMSGFAHAIDPDSPGGEKITKKEAETIKALGYAAIAAIAWFAGAVSKNDEL